MRKILITGSKGQLGRALEKALGEEYRLYLYDIEELDIADECATMEAVGKIKPGCVINCAAYTRVDDCESHSGLAKRINAEGAGNVSKAAAAIGAEVFQISTDYVFDGEGMKGKDGSIRPYTEKDKPGPVSVYGRTKLEGEMLSASENPRHCIIRTAWLYGEGHNFVRTMLRLGKTGGTVRVVDDQTGCPTSADELARAIKRMIFTRRYGIYHAVCGGMCTWYAFAKKIFELTGIPVNLVSIASSDYPTPAKRPKYSVLDTTALERDFGYRLAKWEDALAEYIRNGSGIL
ncbi:MAG: dTDP-4-dehydrorhamnose reductase [Bacillota bacterium]|nr:dTDP-4-dehydrorhamnose reductase [Bacillota bacterium]